ncbi:MAG: hypothetical protein JW731_15135 [Bacteroidales bacterium]|nr:hypothetical protein [Bacteroidales bacterium]
MGMIKNLILLLLFALQLSCAFNWRDDELTFLREDNKSNELRLDGYYYIGEKTIATYFLYRNGIILYTWSTDDLNFTEIENRFIQKEFLDKLKNVKYLWGLYRIEGNRISFERLYPHSPKKAYIRSGYIPNDTTFIITKSMRSDGTEVREKNEVYHFKKFGPKPDSICKFIN